jgi:hypothetical protein
MMFSILTVWENIFEHARDGVLDKDKVARLNGIFALFVCSKGGLEYWEKRKMAFDPEFQEMVDSLDSEMLAPASAINETAVVPRGGGFS